MWDGWTRGCHCSHHPVHTRSLPPPHSRLCFRQVPSPLVLVIHQNSLISQMIRSSVSYPLTPGLPTLYDAAGGCLLPCQAPWERCCLCGPCGGADRKGKSRHWSLMHALHPVLAARPTSPREQEAPRCPVPPWGPSVNVQGRGSSAPALGARSIFSPSPGGRPSWTGSS